MNTFRHMTYMILDELKGNSDDFSFTEDHIIYLLTKYRAFLLRQKYNDVRKQVSGSNYQVLPLSLIEVPAISGEPCEGGDYLRSSIKIPELINIGVPSVYPADFFQGQITLISNERMRYIGYNKYLKNIIYCSIAPDNYLYFKSANPQFLYLEKANLSGVFQDITEVIGHLDNVECDMLDNEFPIEDSLVMPLINIIVKELVQLSRIPADNENNAKDDSEENNRQRVKSISDGTSQESR